MTPRQRLAVALDRAAIPAIVLVILTALYLLGHYVTLWQIEAEAKAWARGVDAACRGGQP